jgi:hypothetical protein
MQDIVIPLILRMPMVMVNSTLGGSGGRRKVQTELKMTTTAQS